MEALKTEYVFFLLHTIDHFNRSLHQFYRTDSIEVRELVSYTHTIEWITSIVCVYESLIVFHTIEETFFRIYVAYTRND